jgi:hypothetical protein
VDGPGATWGTDGVRGWVGHSLALLVQQVEEAGGLLTDEADAAHIVGVVNVMPRDALALVLLLQGGGQGEQRSTDMPLVINSLSFFRGAQDGTRNLMVLG